MTRHRAPATRLVVAAHSWQASVIAPHECPASRRDGSLEAHYRRLTRERSQTRRVLQRPGLADRRQPPARHRRRDRQEHPLQPRASTTKTASATTKRASRDNFQSSTCGQYAGGRLQMLGAHHDSPNTCKLDVLRIDAFCKNQKHQYDRCCANQNCTKIRSFTVVLDYLVDHFPHVLHGPLPPFRGFCTSRQRTHKRKNAFSDNLDQQSCAERALFGMRIEFWCFCRLQFGDAGEPRAAGPSTERQPGLHTSTPVAGRRFPSPAKHRRLSPQHDQGGAAASASPIPRGRINTDIDSCRVGVPTQRPTPGARQGLGLPDPLQRTAGRSRRCRAGPVAWAGRHRRHQLRQRRLLHLNGPAVSTCYQPLTYQ